MATARWTITSSDWSCNIDYHQSPSLRHDWWAHALSGRRDQETSGAITLTLLCTTEKNMSSDWKAEGEEAIMRALPVMPRIIAWNDDKVVRLYKLQLNNAPCVSFARQNCCKFSRIRSVCKAPFSLSFFSFLFSFSSFGYTFPRPVVTAKTLVVEPA